MYSFESKKINKMEIITSSKKKKKASDRCRISRTLYKQEN